MLSGPRADCIIVASHGGRKKATSSNNAFGATERSAQVRIAKSRRTKTNFNVKRQRFQRFVASKILSRRAQSTCRLGRFGVSHRARMFSFLETLRLSVQFAGRLLDLEQASCAERRRNSQSRYQLDFLGTPELLVRFVATHEVENGEAALD